MTWYVYHLRDPRDGLTFYVGKGKGARISGHEKQARMGVTSKKCDRIRDIWAAGLFVERVVVKWFALERAALRFEREEIRRFPAGQLTNVLCVRKPRKWWPEGSVSALATMLKWKSRGATVAAHCEPMGLGQMVLTAAIERVNWRSVTEAFFKHHGDEIASRRLGRYGIEINWA